MALGGGTWALQNKLLPGSYINFVAAARAGAAFGERGVVALPVQLSWGPDDGVFKVTQETFASKTQKIFGYAYDAPELKDLREVFKHARTAYLYRVENGAIKAENTWATAKYKGTRGNDIKVVIAVNIDDTSKFDVTVLLGTQTVDKQTVSAMSELAANDYIDWKANATLAATAATPLSGGSDGSALTGTPYQEFLDAIEGFTFNVLALPIADATIAGVFTAFTRRCREDQGIKFQTVLYRTTADYEGVISVENTVLDAGAPAASLVWWVAGLAAETSLASSATNAIYDGEYDVDVVYSQADLENAVLAGKLILHQVGDDVRVLSDINTLVTVPDDKSEDFKSNHTIRVLDEIGTAIAAEFNQNFIGKVPNDAPGRTSFWSRVVEHHKELQNLRAIEDFSPEDVTVELGDDKKSVLVTDSVTVTGMMEKLYMTVVVE
jgi:hypothetical protein